MKKAKSNIDFTTMFTEIQKKLNRQFRSMDILRKHAEIILGSSSVIVTLFAILQASSISVKQEYFIYYIHVVILLVFLYGILMFFNIKAVLPVPLSHAVKPDWDTYMDTYHGKNERNILRMQVSAYMNAVSYNEVIIIDYLRLEKKIGFLFSIIIILILIASVFPLIP